MIEDYINFSPQEKEIINTFGVEKVHISQIRAGDTVIHNGKLSTVCPKDIKHGIFEGSSLFGDSYRGGTVLVKKVPIMEKRIEIIQKSWKQK